MDGIEVKLLMSFMTNSGRKVSLFVTDPREDVTETEIKEVMDLIIEKISLLLMVKISLVQKMQK